MQKVYYTLLCCCLLSLNVFAQAKPKAPAAAKAGGLQKLLTGSGLPFKMVHDSLAVIPYEGENIESYQVKVLAVAELLIVYTNLSELLPGKMEGTKHTYLLKQNDHFDIVKLALGDDSNVYLRADVYRTTMNTAMITRIIRQVANVTNIIAGELKQP